MVEVLSYEASSVVMLFRLMMVPMFFGLGTYRWGQGKHGFAVHKRGACSRSRCGESPRALGQRVSAGDRRALACLQAVKPLVDLQQQAWAFRSSIGMP
mmetsp:Transcript_78987/g.176993  ORF Transcript_78987/g.176993 Transcript_78987/m.176993 type:complete len:98 (+) Transcript_78987:103-396(+)